MDKVISGSLAIVMIVAGILAFDLKQLSAQHASLNKKLLKQEQDYLWLEKELQSTKQHLASVLREREEASFQKARKQHAMGQTPRLSHNSNHPFNIDPDTPSKKARSDSW